jgi:hypothetical protein
MRLKSITLVGGISVAVVAAAIAVMASSIFALSAAEAADNSATDIVGVWEVDADAPYRPHLFTFHGDGTMTTTNPTNVQENASQPHGGTNDSLGMGVWTVVKDHGQRYVIGTFEQLNAFADNHQPTDKLSVSFRVQLTHNGNGFEGPASARVGADTFPSHLTGTRVDIDQAAVDALP